MDELLKDLRQQIAEKRVVAVVGTGVSLATSGGSEVAGWKGLLESGIQRCEGLGRSLPEGWADRQRAALEHGDTSEWLGVASQVEQQLGGRVSREFTRWLNETVGALSVEDPEILEALKDLDVPVATTNYDHLIKAVFGVDPVTWKDVPRMQEVLKGNDQGILHLHGSYRDPESVILNWRDYERVLRARGAQAIQHLLRTHFTLLYIGYGAGFEDPNFSEWLAWARETFEGKDLARHYRLCLDGERESVQAKHPDADGIFALPYGKKHRELAGFLRGLKPTDTSPSPKTAASSAAGPAPQPLPPPPDWFLGRDDQLAELVEHLVGDSPEPVPILGGAGMGKTGLSLQALHDPVVQAVYGNRRFFVHCDAVADVESFPGAIAQAMGLQLKGDPWKAVLAHLKADPAVLVLDNFETPWEPDRPAAEKYLSALAGVPTVVLVTSVRGLERPNGPKWRSTFEIGRLDPEAARRLFHLITDSQFVDDPDLPRVLRLADGMVLALRLLALAAQGAPLSFLHEAWEAQRTKLLQRGDGREDNLEVSIALSLHGPRIDDKARDLAARCALLPDGIAFEDLEAIAGSRDANEGAHCLSKVGLASLEGARCRMLAPVRQAVRRLIPLTPEAQKQIVGHYLGLVEALGPTIGHEAGGTSVIRLEAEAGNIDASFVRAIDSGDLDSVLKARYGLGELIRFRSICSPDVLEKAAAAAKDDGRLEDQANCTWSLGNIALARSDHDEARRLYEQAQPLYEQVGDLQGQANCIKSLGNIALARSDHDEARRLYEQAQPLYEQVGDLLGQANCIRSLGDIALARSDHDEARRLYEQAQPLFEQVGSLLGQANCIRSLGDIALRRSDHDEARRLYEQAQPLYEQVGSLLGQANCIGGLGDIALEEGEIPKAKEHWLQALESYRLLPDPYSIGWALKRLADNSGDTSDRLRLAEEARDAWLSIDRPDLVDELTPLLENDAS